MNETEIPPMWAAMSNPDKGYYRVSHGYHLVVEKLSDGWAYAVMYGVQRINQGTGYRDLSAVVTQAEDVMRVDKLNRAEAPIAPYAKRISELCKELDEVKKDRMALRAQATLLREALKDYYHECRCNQDDMHAVNKRAYTALQATENLP